MKIGSTLRALFRSRSAKCRFQSLNLRFIINNYLSYENWIDTSRCTLKTMNKLCSAATFIIQCGFIAIRTYATQFFDIASAEKLVAFSVKSVQFALAWVSRKCMVNIQNECYRCRAMAMCKWLSAWLVEVYVGGGTGYFPCNVGYKWIE